MPTKKSDAKIINTSKPNDIVAYIYPEYDRANIQLVSMTQFGIIEGREVK